MNKLGTGALVSKRDKRTVKIKADMATILIDGGTLSALSSVAVVDNLNEQFYVKAVSATEIVI